MLDDDWEGAVDDDEGTADVVPRLESHRRAKAKQAKMRYDRLMEERSLKRMLDDFSY